MFKTMNDARAKLPLEHSLADALRIYAKRLAIFFGVVLLNFVLGGLALSIMRFPRQWLVVTAVLVAVCLVVWLVSRLEHAARAAGPVAAYPLLLLLLAVSVSIAVTCLVSPPMLSPVPTPTATPVSHCIYVGATLCPGYDIGVDDSAGRRNWVTDMNGYMGMVYPSGLNWGVVFITVGEPTNPPRPSEDLSAYRALSVELRGETGGESVYIGLKDNMDADDGSETKVLVSNLTTSWQTFTFALSDFATADVTRLYVVSEFVFEPDWPSQTIYFRNIRYLP